MKREFLSRRDMLASAALAGGAVAASGARAAAQEVARATSALEAKYSDAKWDVPGEAGKDYNAVVTPNGWTLPSAVVGGVKVFHLVAEEVEHEFAPGLVGKCWGYNGSVHGPTIEAVAGDRVRVYVTNRLPEATTVHWHGLIIPNGMDGVGGLSQAPIEPGETYRYEFTLLRAGTYMYHSHHDEMTQMALGLMGMFVVHERGLAREKRPDRDFALMLSEWFIQPGASRPDPNKMNDFNVLTINARVFPGTEPLVCKQGDRVRIRIGNLSAMDHHPMHMHGNEFTVITADGAPIPAEARSGAGTVLVPVGGTRDVEFVAANEGDWSLHCHMTHHVMTQMGHDAPNVTGANLDEVDDEIRKLVPKYMSMGTDGMGDMGHHMKHMAHPENSLPMVGGDGPHGYITMGGMFTVVKVRKELPKGYDADPGWYENPPGTLAVAATEGQLSADGVDPKNPPRRKAKR